MNRTPEQTDRLRTLSRELRKVKPEDFSIQSFCSTLDPMECGSTACAVGHCPRIFPDDWKWDESIPLLRNDSMQSPLHDADIFFGLSQSEGPFLFSGYKYETDNPTPSDVSDRIDRLLAGGTI